MTQYHNLAILIGLLGTGFIILSSLLIGSRLAKGWLVSCIGQALFLCRGLIAHDWDICLISIIFLVIAIWNYIKWTNKSITEQYHDRCVNDRRRTK